MTNQVEFRYGAISDNLEKQANEQGYSLGEKAEELERCKKAIITLMFGEILTDSQKDKAYQKLHKRVLKALKPLKSEV
jgi:hypothetical protein